MKNLQTNMKKGFLLAVLLLATSVCMAQVEDRERPAEWEGLIEGGRFMDRLLPMPDGRKGERLWGAQAVQNRYVDNGLEETGMSYWGGNILKTDDGKYHLYVAGWPEDSPKGHMFWKYSTVYHAVSDSPIGPFRVVNTVGKGHNPEAYRLDDGRVVVYVIDGYYIGDAPDSKVWHYGRFTFDERNRNIIEGLSNLSFCRRQDGSRLMVCRGGGIWISRDGLTDAYRQLTDHRVYPPVKGEFEDPVIWRDSLQYHLIVNDWLGRIAWYERSLDGLHWIVEPGEAYLPGVARHKNGEVEDWFKYERPKIMQDAYGRAEQINFAVIDTLKNEDLPRDRHSSKNIGIPLNPGLLLEVLDPLTPKTKRIRVRVKATPECTNPLAELDLGSIRFGGYEVVNYGGGSKVQKATAEGNDLILTFDVKTAQIASDDWAPKLLGCSKKGEMVYGYASRPDIDYRPAILSAGSIERGTANGATVLRTRITNFGLSASRPCEVEFVIDGQVQGRVPLSALHPYEEKEVTLPVNTSFATDTPGEIRFYCEGNLIDTNHLKVKK